MRKPSCLVRRSHDTQPVCERLFSNGSIVPPPAESRQRRQRGPQSRRQEGPEAQEEAGREERQGGVQEGARRRR